MVKVTCFVKKILNDLTDKSGDGPLVLFFIYIFGVAYLITMGLCVIGVDIGNDIETFLITYLYIVSIFMMVNCVVVVFNGLINYLINVWRYCKNKV